MSNVATEKKTTTPNGGGFSGLFKKEDYWAVWLGLGLTFAAIILWATGSSFMKWIAIKIPSYDSINVPLEYLGNNVGAIITLFFVLAVLFGFALKILGHKVKDFIVGFSIIFILTLIISVLGSWNVMKSLNLEAPLLALALGLVIGNFIKMPKWMDSALRTEFFVKTGIVLMGATLPFTLIVEAGPIAFAQATVIAVLTFVTIYFVGSKVLGLDKRFATCLAAGGSICGVSASIAIGGSVRAEKQHVSVAISLVVVWAMIMIFALPFMIKALGIPSGPAGAWIGTSEFADAAGMAAAAAIDEQAIKTFTLMKVVGRDMFVGIWCFVMALIAVTKWEKREDGVKPSPGEIWYRFPKFVLGFFAASIIITLLFSTLDPAAVASAESTVVSPLKTLRSWAFNLTFICIGLTTRFRELTSVGWKPLAAFTAGVAVNVPVGYLLSVVLLGDYWSSIV